MSTTDGNRIFIPFNYLCYFLSTTVLEPLFFRGMFFHLIWCSSIFSDILGNSLNWITGLHLTWVQLLSFGKLSSIRWSTNAMCCGIWHHLHNLMCVFHVFKIVQMVTNRAKHHKWIYTIIFEPTSPSIRV